MPKLTQCNVDRNSSPLDNAPLPYVKWYVSDWIVDTSSIGIEASGAYVHLCMVWWTSQRPLPSEVADLSQLLGLDDRTGEFLLRQIAHLFRDVDGGVEPIRFAKYRKDAARRLSYSRAGNVAKVTKTSTRCNVDRNSSPLDVDRNSTECANEPNVDYLTKKSEAVNISVRGCSGVGAEPNGSRASEYTHDHDLSNQEEIILPTTHPSPRSGESRCVAPAVTPLESSSSHVEQAQLTIAITEQAPSSPLGSGTTRKRARSHVVPATDEPADFAAWWTAYPRKSGRPTALKSWLRDKPDLVVLMRALAWQTRSEQWTSDGGRFIPMPATYLNQRRYEDEPIAPMRHLSPTTIANQAAVREFLAQDKPPLYTPEDDEDDEDAF